MKIKKPKQKIHKGDMCGNALCPVNKKGLCWGSHEMRRNKKACKPAAVVDRNP
jgi:hypothetical protein